MLSTIRDFLEVRIHNGIYNRHKRIQMIENTASHIFVGTSSLKADILKNYAFPTSHICVNPMPCPSDILNISKRTGMSRSKTLFYPAQFWQHKNHIRLVHAFSKFISDNSNGSDWSLYLIGGDRDNNLIRVKNLVKHLGLESNVIFTGFLDRSELLHFYSNSHALIYQLFWVRTIYHP